MFLSVLDNIAPKREVRLKQRTQPWITPDILQSIENREKAFYARRTDEFFNSFKEIRNKTQSLILKAKKRYFSEKLEQYKNQSKSLWNTLK